jgi:hypothetical protein
MGEIKGSPSYLRPDIGDGTASTDGLGRNVLPFKDLDRTGEREGIVVQIKVLTPIDTEGVQVMSAIQNALRGLTVGGKPVALVLTREGVEMSYADKEILANMIAPLILRRLGIRDGIGGNLMGVR